MTPHVSFFLSYPTPAPPTPPSQYKVMNSPISLAMSGRTRDVGGRILETSSRNTTSDSRIDIPRVTFSPASAGR